MKKETLARAVAGICLFALGFLGGRRHPADASNQGADLSQNVAELDSGSPIGENLIEKVDAVASAEIPGLFSQWNGDESHSIESLRALRALSRRWIIEDPDAAFAHIVELGSDSRANLVKEWIAIDTEDFMNRLVDLGDAGVLRDLSYYVAASNPLLLLSFCENRPKIRGPIGLVLQSAILQVAQTSPADAVAFLESLKIDPASAMPFRLADGSRVQTFNSSIYAEVARTYAKLDPEAALDWAESQESPGSRRSMMETVIASWALHSPEDAGAAYTQLKGDTGIDPDRIVRDMVSFDPEGALKWVIDYAPAGKKRSLVIDHATELRDTDAIRRVHGALEGSRFQGAFMTHLLMNWNDRSPEAGLQWVLSVPPERQEYWLRELGGGIGDNAFESGMELASQLSNPKLREALEAGLIRSLAATDFERASELARASGDEDLLLETLDWGVYRNAQNTAYSYSEVASWLDDIEGGSYHDDVARDLVRRWYHDDPIGAMAWVESLDGQVRREAMWELGQSMAFRDPDKAPGWASSLPSARDRDRAIPAVLNSLASKSPERAFPMALQISNPRNRLREAKDVIRIWAKRDPDLAWSTMVSSDVLTAKEKQRLAALFYGIQ